MSSNQDNNLSGSTTGAGGGGIAHAKAVGQNAADSSEKARQGANQYLDDVIQPSAARDAELGMTSQHKQPINPDAPGSKGHNVIDGPAMGTGMSHKGPFHSQDPRAGKTGLVADAKNLGYDVKTALSGGNQKHATADSSFPGNTPSATDASLTEDSNVRRTGDDGY